MSFEIPVVIKQAASGGLGPGGKLHARHGAGCCCATLVYVRVDTVSRYCACKSAYLGIESRKPHKPLGGVTVLVKVGQSYFACH